MPSRWVLWGTHAWWNFWTLGLRYDLELCFRGVVCMLHGFIISTKATGRPGEHARGRAAGCEVQGTHGNAMPSYCTIALHIRARGANFALPAPQLKYSCAMRANWRLTLRFAISFLSILSEGAPVVPPTLPLTQPCSVHAYSLFPMHFRRRSGCCITWTCLLTFPDAFPMHSRCVSDAFPAQERLLYCLDMLCRAGLVAALQPGGLQPDLITARTLFQVGSLLITGSGRLRIFYR